MVVCLTQLTVDAKLQAQCLSVIWKAPDDRRVFPKMHLDPVGRKHVFVAVRDKVGSWILEIICTFSFSLCRNVSLTSLLEDYSVPVLFSSGKTKTKMTSSDPFFP